MSYQNDTYAKIKAELYDKKSGYLCENKRKYKVYKSFITHWKKYDYKNIWDNKWELEHVYKSNS